MLDLTDTRSSLITFPFNYNHHYYSQEVLYAFFKLTLL